ncbi:DUF4983 domain-containing protein [Mucilaginibacter mali]|uniref:DUF4983 domain-containing protein n=1 Tax=Mucilaginibacter mali TaxID=2740462 RepID=A0A7D4UPT7_9SPHI|nr:DUF4983 domain-containing protein [Mucilaginibacter mali]QKJ31080.1 DUF4983 domain-containing protein [Mucilaginibacter mali]
MREVYNTKKGFLINVIGLACLTLTLILGSSCNKDFPSTLRTEYPNDTASVVLKQKKVLYIILDGVRGNAIKILNPPNLATLVKKAIYTYDGLTDFNSTPITNAGGWATAMTSVTSDQHKITTEDFAGNQLANFPSMFTRFKQVNPALRTASIASSKIFNDYLATDATFKANFENDDAKVKDATVDELKNANAGIVLAQFHSAETVGAASGYTDTSTPYLNALTQLDTYVGNLMSALSARATIAKEDWLVVIASNKGGTIPAQPGAGNLGAFGDPAKNSFVIFYNPRFLTQVAPKPDPDAFPYSGYAPNFVSTLSSGAVANLSNTSVGNFGAAGDFTLMFKLRSDAAAIQRYPHFLGKRSVPYGTASTGWSFLYGDDNYQLDWGGTPRPGGGKVRDGIWHTIAMVISGSGSTRVVGLFTDGVKNSSSTIGTKNVDNTNPLRLGTEIGTNANTLANSYIKDLAIYNVAFSDADVIAAMRKEILPTSARFSNLIGWWPGNESTGNTIADKSGKGNNFTISGNVNFVPFTDVSPNISPEITAASYRVVINSVDVPFEIYQWMGVVVPNSWALQGKTWKPTYTDVRNN